MDHFKVAPPISGGRKQEAQCCWLLLYSYVCRRRRRCSGAPAAVTRPAADLLAKHLSFPPMLLSVQCKRL